MEPTPTPTEMAYIIRMAEQARREQMPGQTIATWLQMHANDVDHATWYVNDLKRRLNRPTTMSTHFSTSKISN